MPALLGLVRFSHTIFALPFALSAALLAGLEIPRASTWPRSPPGACSVYR